MSNTIKVPDAVRASFTGEPTGRGDPGYEQARRVRNGLINKHPALIARCRTVPGMVDAVRLSRVSLLMLSRLDGTGTDLLPRRG